MSAGHYVATVRFILGEPRLNRFIRACDLGIAATGEELTCYVQFAPHVTADDLAVELDKLVEASLRNEGVEILSYTILSTSFVEDEG